MGERRRLPEARLLRLIERRRWREARGPQPCADCGTTARPVKARGLCDRCYSRHEQAGTLGRYPRLVERPAARRYVPRPGASAIWLLPGEPQED